MSNISPLRSDSREDGISSEHPKPQGPPPSDDHFRKSMRERPPTRRESQEHHIEEHKERRSVFDLSKSSKSKDKSHVKEKGSKGSDDTSHSVSKRPIKPKQDLSEHEQDQQHPEEEALVTSDSSDIPEPADDLYATAKETPPTPQDRIAKQTKPPVQQPLAGLKPEHAATAAPSQKTKVPREKSSFETGELGSASKKQKTSKGEGSKSDITEVKEGAVGAAAVNASIQSAGFHSEKIPESQETAPSATIRELATQIVDRIQVMRKDNETHTTLTLRHPPILEGATITLTTSDHAKREFNIAFANLSPDAKMFLDLKLKENSLTEALDRKGITVHMLTTSTQSESIITADAGQTSRDRQDQQQEQQQQQRRQSFRERVEEEEE